MKVQRLVNRIMYLVVTVALVTTLCGSVATSFDIRWSQTAVIWSSLAVSAVMLVLCEFVKSRAAFAGGCAAVGIILAALVLLRLDTLVAQAFYSFNCAMLYYSSAYAGFSTIVFPGEVAVQADGLFAVLSLLLSAFFAPLLMRSGKLAAVTVISLLLILPSFIIVDTVPDEGYILSFVAILGGLYVTSFLRRRSFAYSGFALIPVTAVLLCLAFTVNAIFPQKNYQRAVWLDEVRGQLENLTGITGSHGEGSGELAFLKTQMEEQVDIASIGKLSLDHRPVLSVLTASSETVYLRQASYANFDDNAWSMLSEEQLEAFPTHGLHFTVREDLFVGDGEQISVRTRNPYPYAFTPYYLTEFPDESQMSTVNDIMVNNPRRLTDYSFRCMTDPDEHSYAFHSDGVYEQFISEYYTVLPERTRALMEPIIRENIDVDRSADEPDVEAIVDQVRNFVSKSAKYSLDCDKMPEGRDFPTWFLTEADKGYCMHFATAAVAMLRALNVPSRYAVGYLGRATPGEWSQVTTDNAHAWAEYYDSDRGWVPLEATPAGSVPFRTETIQPTTAAPATQSTGATAPTAPQQKHNTPGAFRLSLKGFEPVIAVVLAVAAIALLVVLRVRWLRRRREKGFHSGSAKERALFAYRYLLRVTRGSALVIEERYEEIALRARFGNRRISEEEVRALQQLALQFRAERLQNAKRLQKLYLLYVLVI